MCIAQPPLLFSISFHLITYLYLSQAVFRVIYQQLNKIIQNSALLVFTPFHRVMELITIIFERLSQKSQSMRLKSIHHHQNQGLQIFQATVFAFYFRKSHQIYLMNELFVWIFTPNLKASSFNGAHLKLFFINKGIGQLADFHCFS